MQIASHTTFLPGQGMTSCKTVHCTIAVSDMLSIGSDGNRLQQSSAIHVT